MLETDGNSSDNDDSSSDTESGEPTPAFNPLQCLFCSLTSSNFDNSVMHMHKAHGLFIPITIDGGTKHLVVDLETLVQYIHLVVFKYHECLFCHTERQSSHAAQQHMMGKGHCRIHLDEADAGEDSSEFRDFYEQPATEDDDGDANGEAGMQVVKDGRHSAAEHDHYASSKPHMLDASTLRLATGKVLSTRSAAAAKARQGHRPLAKTTGSRGGVKAHLEGIVSAASACTEKEAASASQAAPLTLTRPERRLLAGNSNSTLSIALSQMSLRDRSALAHLSPAEQRATVVRQFKQQDRMQAADRRYWSKVELRPNKCGGGLKN